MSDIAKNKQIALFTDSNYTTVEDAWLIDSVATHHVCRHEKWFENLKRIKPEPILILLKQRVIKTKDHLLQKELAT